jgi:HKD family nuclease
VRARLISTPFDDTAPPLGQILKDALADERFMRLDMVVAWVKRSGLRLIAPDIERFRDRGGEVHAIVGVDERGATRQGLELVRAKCNEVIVYREPAGGTFHPKLYLFRGTRKAMLIVGSSNMTRGGLFDNYEASLCIELELPADNRLLESADKYIDLLRAQEEVALGLDDTLMARLISSPFVQDEDRHRHATSADSESRAPILPFGRVSAKKVAAPATPSRTRGTRTPVARPARRPGRTVGETQDTEIERRWFKPLSASDAQQPPTGGTNVTGVLRLTRSDFDIDQTTFFRQTLLRTANWRRATVSGQPAEVADINFEVRIDQRFVGRRRLRVSHAAHREEAQRNVTTVLHWGPLSALLRAQTRTGSWVVIDVDSDGQFGLSIQRSRPSMI